MDEDQHTPRGTKHLDDDDEDVSYDEKTGISAEVRVQVTCGDMRGTAVLPAGYKKQQEYVLHSDGKKVPPSQFERDAGKGSCKNWKNSVMVVMPDGSEGRTFRVWMESNGYFPVGTKWDESVVNAARALMGRRKKVTSSTGASHAVKTQPAAKKPKPAPAQAAKKVEKASASVEKVAEKAPVEKSIFEAQLENLLDDDGGLRLVEKMPNFVWLMRNAMKNAERSLVVSVIHRTNDRRCAEAFVKSDGIKVLHEWCAQAKEANKSSLVLKMLKTFRRLPMTVTALSSTGLGNFRQQATQVQTPWQGQRRPHETGHRRGGASETKVGLGGPSRVGGSGRQSQEGIRGIIQTKSSRQRRQRRQQATARPADRRGGCEAPQG